jgi:putative endonuclease
MRSYWVYILASKPRGTLYIGVTNDILGRSQRHREGEGSRFTSKYGVGVFVYFEEFADVKSRYQS